MYQRDEKMQGEIMTVCFKLTSSMMMSTFAPRMV